MIAEHNPELANACASSHEPKSHHGHAGYFNRGRREYHAPPTHQRPSGRHGSGKLIGIVSEGDFLRREEIGTQRKRSRWLSFIVGPGRSASEFVHAQGRKIGEVMTPEPLIVSEETPL